jgi:hypothetical protein
MLNIKRTLALTALAAIAIAGSSLYAMVVSADSPYCEKDSKTCLEAKSLETDKIDRNLFTKSDPVPNKYQYAETQNDPPKAQIDPDQFKISSAVEFQRNPGIFGDWLPYGEEIDDQTEIPQGEVIETSAPVHIRNLSQYDINEVWLVSGGGPGYPLQQELLTSDLSQFHTPVYNYNNEIVSDIEKQHTAADEPNVTPYYILEYVQEHPPALGGPYYTNRQSTAFAPGVHHVAGYDIVRETMFLFDGDSTPRTRFEQILRGPDGQLYAYRPGSFFFNHPETTHGPLLFQTLVNEGYTVYNSHPLAP